MPDIPKKPYIVALQFGLPPQQIIHVNGVVAVGPEMAIAIATSMTIQQLGITESLTGFAMQELTEDFLIAALNAVRGRPIKNEGAAVSLVTPPPITLLPRGSKHESLLGLECPGCHVPPGVTHRDDCSLLRHPGDDGAAMPPPKEAEVLPHSFCRDYLAPTPDVCVCGLGAGHPIHTGAA